MFEVKDIKIGLGICYDIRFPELSLLMANQGAKVLIFPSSFSTTTGPPHFELLGRARALDCQVYVILAAPARDNDDKESYPTWSHSMIINPNGAVIQKTEFDEVILYQKLDMGLVERQRKMLPYNSQKRLDVYSLKQEY